MKIQIGETLLLRCQGCPRWFEWVVSDGWWAGVPAHHGRKCRHHHAERRNRRESFEPCRRPEKRLYRTQEEAQAIAISLSRQYQELFTVYRCDCGGLHVGRVRFKRVAPAPRSALADLADELDRLARPEKEDA